MCDQEEPGDPRTDTITPVCTDHESKSHGRLEIGCVTQPVHYRFQAGHYSAGC